MKLRSLATLVFVALMGCQAAPSVSVKASTTPKPDTLRLSNATRIHVFLGPVRPEAAFAIVSAIEKAEATGKSVLLEIDSPGGHVGAALLIVKKLERAKVPVVCLVDGSALSSAMIILAACPKRQATSRSRLMFHQPSFSGDVNDVHITDLLDMAKQLYSLWVSMCHQMAARSKLPAEVWFEKSDGKEFWMNVPEALTWGVIDEIVEPLQANR